ncbi:tyrosine-type recombinase/integrase [Alloyangia pacifica]|uniref:Integrase n=1 Tax=Alloyangia pacifica TaxID=311180 RepID=A0A1I6PPY9_9RHOB|nr:integrase arm-type DNA-binding domain-containing protein [Alloyangia pacifica]SDG32728.1 Integrase [Alloyangia pacifica]SFS42105.1 Integrase [Alloyangia pacifica]
MLTAQQIKALKPKKSEFRIADGSGLYLVIKPSGRKLWRLRFRRDGKDAQLVLGDYPAMSPVQARRAAAELQEGKARGIDPAAAFHADRPTSGDEESFRAITEKFIAAKMEGRKVEAHVERFRNRMEKDVLPILGSTHPRDITPRDILRALAPIERRGAIDTSHRVRGMISQVLRYALALQLCDRDVSADVIAALPEAPKTAHRPAVTTPDDLGELLRDIEDEGPSAGREIIRLCLLTLQRPGEVRAMKWADVDLDAGLWRVPITKVSAELITPLPKQAVAILRTLDPGHRQNVYVFASTGKSGYVSDVLPSKVLAKAGWKGRHSAHGSRATGRTMLAEVLGYPERVIEAQLSHGSPESLGRAYDRSAFLPQRREMLSAWADYLDRLRESDATSRQVA